MSNECQMFAPAYADGAAKAKVAQVAFDYVERRVREIDGPVAVRAECKADAGSAHGIDCLYGTADIVLVGDTVLEIGDLKSGRMNVDPDDPQLLIYGYGMLQEYMHPDDKVLPFDTVRLTIIQPRGDNPGHIRFVEYSAEDLVKRFKQEILPAAKNALSDDPKAVASTSGCKWCKAGAECPERAAFNMGVLGATMSNVSEVVDDKNVAAMSVDEMISLHDAAPGIRSFLDDIADSLKTKLKNRDPEVRKHLKLVAGRQSQVYTMDSESLIKKLKNTHKFKNAQIYKTSLRTPADIQKAEGLTAKQIEGVKKLIEKKAGGMVMAPASSSKPDAMPAQSSMADMVDQESKPEPKSDFLN
jgi:hypothetical protein